jgi:hypothetical protein
MVQRMAVKGDIKPAKTASEKTFTGTALRPTTPRDDATTDNNPPHTIPHRIVLPYDPVRDDFPSYALREFRSQVRAEKFRRILGMALEENEVRRKEALKEVQLWDKVQSSAGTLRKRGANTSDAGIGDKVGDKGPEASLSPQDAIDQLAAVLRFGDMLYEVSRRFV